MAYSVLITGVPPEVETEFLDIFSQSFPKCTKFILTGQLRVLDFPKTGHFTWHLSPRNDDKKYLNWLINLINLENVKHIIPLIDSEVVFLSKNRSKLNGYEKLKIWTAEYDSVKRVVDKLECYNFARGECYIPDFLSAINPRDLKKSMQILRKRHSGIVVRPANEVNGSGKGVRFLTNQNMFLESIFHQSVPSTHMSYDEYILMFELAYKSNNLPVQLLTEMLSGDEYSCYILAKNGAMQYCSIHKKIANQKGSTNSGIAEIVNSEEVYKTCEQVTKKYALDLINNIQLRRDKHGELKLIEINPRVAGSIHLSAAHNRNIIKACLNQIENISQSEFFYQEDFDYSPRITRSHSVQLTNKMQYLHDNIERSRCFNNMQSRVSSPNFGYIVDKYIELIIFDLDNTLYSEWDYINLACKEFLEMESQFSEIQIQLILKKLKFYYRENGNYGIFDTLEEIVSNEQFNKKHATLSLKHFRYFLQKDSQKEIKIVPEALQLLKTCKEKDIPILLVTDGNIDQQKNKIKNLRLRNFICDRHIYFGDEFGGKDSEKFTKYLLEETEWSNFFKAKSDKVMVVGDSKHDKFLSNNLKCWFMKMNVGIVV